MMSFNSERRRFLRYGAGAVTALIFAPLLRAQADALPLLKSDDPMAKTMGYYPDASKVDVKKWAKKASPDGKAQKCGNCMFYAGVDKNTGKCQIFPANTVNADGWCNSWAQKPG